jgi:hypothetical protein
VLDDARLLDLVQHFLRRPQRTVHLGHRQDDRELVAAETRHGVGLAQHAAHPRRHTRQHAVAGVMAERVVDLLEAVQVEDQQRQRRARAVGHAQQR